MSGRTRWGIVVGVAALGLALTGCAAGAGPTESYPGLPEHVDASAVSGEPQAFYLENAGAIAVVLWGSSTCPPIGERMVVEEPASAGNVVRVDVRAIPEDRACTRDLVPHTSVFVTPSDVTTTSPLTIRVADAEIELVDAVTE